MVSKYNTIHPFPPHFLCLFFHFLPLKQLPSDYLTPEERWGRGASGVLLLWDTPRVTKAWPGYLSCREGLLKHCSLCYCCANVSLHLQPWRAQFCSLQLEIFLLSKCDGWHQPLAQNQPLSFKNKAGSSPSWKADMVCQSIHIPKMWKLLGWTVLCTGRAEAGMTSVLYMHGLLHTHRGCSSLATDSPQNGAATTANTLGG